MVADEKALVALLLETEKPDRVRFERQIKSVKSHPILNETEDQLNEYFRGDRTAFNVELSPQGTEFQRKVWSALRRVRHGRTSTYREIADLIGHPKAVRAVGAAIGRNPICVIIPCHRVIGSNGTLTGFAGGLEVKQKLLTLETSRRAVSRSTSRPDRATAFA